MERLFESLVDAGYHAEMGSVAVVKAFMKSADESAERIGIDISPQREEVMKTLYDFGIPFRISMNDGNEVQTGLLLNSADAYFNEKGIDTFVYRGRVERMFAKS